jgi:hypothetical protein
MNTRFLRCSLPTVLLPACLAVGVAGSAQAVEAPTDKVPAIEGNPGLPGLLATIAQLEESLEQLASELAAAEAELSETRVALSTTTENLSLTQLALDATTVDLDVNRALLDEALDALEREQNTYRVPSTGQERCFDALTSEPDDPHETIFCSGTGQDGEYRAGLAAPFGRFVDNDDGTLTDRFTGLVWLNRTNCADARSWYEALELAASLSGTLAGGGLCNLADGSLPGEWRVPNVRELLSLVDYGSLTVTREAMYAGGSPFIGGGGFLWSSTTWALPSDTPVGDLLYATFSRGYGQDIAQRFNDAYVVSIGSGRVIPAPKEKREAIGRRHRVTNLNTINGFENGAPSLGITPRFIAVRDAWD